MIELIHDLQKEVSSLHEELIDIIDNDKCNTPEEFADMYYLKGRIRGLQDTIIKIFDQTKARGQ